MFSNKSKGGLLSGRIVLDKMIIMPCAIYFIYLKKTIADNGTDYYSLYIIEIKITSSTNAI